MTDFSNALSVLPTDLPEGVDALLEAGDDLGRARCIELKQAVARLLGGYRHQFQNKDFSEFLVTSKNEGRLAKIRSKIKEQGGFSEFLLCRHKTGIPLKVGWLFVEDMSTSNFRAKILEVVRRGHRWSLEHYLEQYDFITGLADRELVFKYLVEQMEKARKTGMELDIAFVELKNYEFFNAETSTGAAEYVMAEMTKRLLECLPRNTIPGRIAADTFVIFLLGFKSNKRMETLFRTLFRKLLEPVLGENFIYSPEISAGIAGFSDEHMEPYDLLDKVGLALRWAKNEPGNNYRFYFKKMADREYWYK